MNNLIKPEQVICLTKGIWVKVIDQQKIEIDFLKKSLVMNNTWYDLVFN